MVKIGHYEVNRESVCFGKDRKARTGVGAPGYNSKGGTTISFFASGVSLPEIAGTCLLSLFAIMIATKKPSRPSKSMARDGCAGLIRPISAAPRSDWQ